MEGLQELTNAVPSPTPYGLPFPKIGGVRKFATQPKTTIAIMSGTCKATDNSVIT